MASPITKELLTLEVSVLEQAVVLYFPRRPLNMVARKYGIAFQEFRPYSTGMTLETSGCSLYLKPLDLGCLPPVPFSHLVKMRSSYGLVWGKVMDGARCYQQPVGFEMNPGGMVGHLPSSHDRTWPKDMEGEDYFPTRATALREIRARQPLTLLEIPHWAQRELTPEERVQLHNNNRLD